MAIKIETKNQAPQVPENLKTTNFLKLPNDNEKEGVDFINISFKSENRLGRELHPNYSRTFNTVLGKVASVRNFTSLITIPGYPVDLVNKRNLLPEEQARIPKGRISPVNYWALVAYAICERILQDKKIKAELQKNKAYLTAFESYEAPSLFKGRTNLNRSVKSATLRLSNYIAILRAISEMIKKNKFNRDDISEFIEQCKADPSKDVFEGVPDAIKAMLEQGTTAEEAHVETQEATNESSCGNCESCGCDTESDETSEADASPESPEPEAEEAPKKSKKTAKKAE